MKFIESTIKKKSLIQLLEDTQITVSMNLLELLVLVSNYGCTTAKDSHEHICAVTGGIKGAENLYDALRCADKFELADKANYSEMKQFLIERLKAEKIIGEDS